MQRNIIISFILILIAHGISSAQDSILGLLKNNVDQANRHYENGEYEKALKTFSLVNPRKIGKESELKIARCYYYTKKYAECARVYTRLQSSTPLPIDDLQYFAEVQTSTGNYAGAIDSYRYALKESPGDALILQRIWQLSNLHLLYEDSVHYSLRRLPFNTAHAELSPVPFDKGVVFLSDRKEIDFQNTDSDVTNNDFNLFYTEITGGTLLSGLNSKFKKPVRLGKIFHATSGLGPVSFYAGNTKCIFACLASELSNGGADKMQLFFSEFLDGEWSTPRAFEHNNSLHNFSEPSISPDGQSLYFASDKPGGLGGTDIYRCQLKDGKWTSPENAGDHINTRLNESFPFFYFNTLYFASDGHPGLGGLDIFSTMIAEENFTDVKNLGYPLNSGGDDFGFVLQTGSRGFLTSNRFNGGYDDDVYEFEMDFRAYPFDITGKITLRNTATSDSSRNQPLTNTKIELVDFVRSRVIFQTVTDARGGFTLSIPYFSKYVVRLTDDEHTEYIISLEIDRESSKNSDYEIVVIKQSTNGSHDEHIQNE